MKELVVISGKGGTGKTSLTAAFAALAEKHVLCDADVDAADLHLLLKPIIKQRTEFIGGNKAIIKQDVCNQCRTCIDLCRFDAISEEFEVNLLDCEGCGVCVALCPEKAIDFPQQKCGEWFISETRFGPMVHARLGIAEENSGKLVSIIRKQAKELGEQQHHNLMITDGPPGIGCPVIASITGATAVLIVVEPTLSGMHDMERVADLAGHFTIPALVCINKYDINPEIAVSIEQEAGRRNLQVVGSIPFDSLFTRAMVAGKTLVEYEPTSQITRLIKDIWHTISISEAFNKKRAEYILPVLNN